MLSIRCLAAVEAPNAPLLEPPGSEIHTTHMHIRLLKEREREREKREERERKEKKRKERGEKDVSVRLT